MNVFWFIRFLCLIALIMTPFMAFEVSAQTQNAQIVPAVNILRGEFVQIRSLKGFKNPLRSEGRFIVSKSHGVVWQNIKPYPSRVLIKNTGEIVNLDQSQKATVKPAKKPNAMMSKIMLALLSGNQAEITKHFTIQRTENKGNWTVRLHPKGTMARVFSSLVMQGERYIHNVLMVEKSGDKTELRFTAVSEEPGFLSAEELKYFQ